MSLPNKEKLGNPDRLGPFSSKLIKEILARPIELERSPAVKILTDQLQRIGGYVEEQLPKADEVTQSVSIAR